MLAIIRDESGSMRNFRQAVGEFLPAVRRAVIERGGPKLGSLLYLLYVVISGGVVTTDFVSLDEAVDPSFTPDGDTPIGAGLAVVADKTDRFLNDVVFPAGTTVKALEVLVVSDLKANGETPEATAAGVAKFVDMMKKFRATVTVVGTTPQETDLALAARLDVTEKGISYLDTADPKAVINVSVDSLLAASRPLTGSAPRIR